MTEPRYEIVHGAGLRPYLATLAELRIQVFREWPYLYDGSADYELRYLERYAESSAGVVVFARVGERIVGASTGLPLEDADEAFAIPLREGGYDPKEIFYFGESVLLPEFRGFGIGRAFFDIRERHAREQEARFGAFCAVERGEADPRKPVDYRTLDGMWERRGYVRYPEIRARFGWKELGSGEEVANELVFWVKQLNS